MATLIRYTPNARGIRDVARSRQVDAMLERRAGRVAAAAEGAYAVHGEDVTVEVLQQGSDTPRRARVAVIARSPQAIRLELRHRVLGGSLDAGR